MRLWIDNQLMQLKEDTIISLTKEDATSTNPASLTTSYTKTISLPRTPVNEKAFAYLGSLQSDFTQMSFSPIKKVRAALEIWDGFVSYGYAHCDKLTSDTIEVSLYLDLTQPFTDLQSIYTGSLFEEYNEELWMDQSVLNAHWNLLGGRVEPTEEQLLQWGYGLNWCPTFSGIPDNYRADSALVYTNEESLLYPLSGELEHNGTTIEFSGVKEKNSNKGYGFIEGAEEVDCMAMRDFRWYLQRPMVSMKAFFTGIKKYAEEHFSWRLSLDAPFFSSPYYNLGWIVFPAIKIDDNKDALTGSQCLAKGKVCRSYIGPASGPTPEPDMGTYKSLINTKAFCNWEDKTVLDILLSITKRFNLVWVITDASTLRCVSRHQLHKTLYETKALDTFIDEESIEVEPFNTTTRWIKYVDNDSDAEYGKLYKELYNRPFGEYRVNTNNEFADEKDELMAIDSVFSNTPSAIRSDKHYRYAYHKDVLQDLPVQIWDGTVDYKLQVNLPLEGYVNETYCEMDAAQVEYMKTGHIIPWGDALQDRSLYYYGQPEDYNQNIGLSYWEMLDCQEEDGGSINDSYELVFYEGMQTPPPSGSTLYTPWKCIVSNDSVAMEVFNEGSSITSLTSIESQQNNPWCWIFNTLNGLEQSTSLDFTIRTSIPLMSKYDYYHNTIINSMDYSVPKRIFVDKTKWTEGSAAYNDDACIYEQYWKDWLSDLYDQNTLKMSCTLSPTFLSTNSTEKLLACGGLYTYRGVTWRLLSIDELAFDMKGRQSIKCTFIKVNYPNLI